MKLIPRLIATDVRQFWRPLAAWVLVVSFGSILHGSRSSADFNPIAVDAVSIARGLLRLAQGLLLFLLVPFVVQAHPAVGSDAFWMTRPVPPLALLASKLNLLAAAIIAAPVAATAALMVSHQMPAREIALIAADTAVFYGTVMLVLMAIAALTPDLWRFVLVCGSLLAAIAISLTTATMILISRIDDEPFPSVGVGGDGLVFTVLSTASLVALLVVQYRTRTRTRSVPIGVAGLVIASVVASVWPWPLLQPRIALPQWAGDDTVARLNIDVETIATQAPMPFARRDPWRSISARIDIGDLPAGWSATTVVSEASLDLGNVVLRAPRYAYSNRAVLSGAGAPDGMVPVLAHYPSPPNVLAHLLDVQRVIDPAPPFTETAVVFFVREADFRQYAPATGSYRGRFWVGLTRHEIEAAMPLQPGRVHRNGADRFLVDQVQRTPVGLTVFVRQSQAKSMFDMRLPPSFTFYLRNRQRAEALASSAYISRGEPFLERLLPFIGTGEWNSGFSIRGVRMDFPPRYGTSQETFTLDDPWIAGAELVIVRSTPSGSIRRAVTLPQFPLQEPPPTRAVSAQPVW